MKRLLRFKFTPIIAALVIVSAASVAMASTQLSPDENRPYAGEPNSGALVASADAETAPGKAGEENGTHQWGVLAFRSGAGLTCVAAGPVVNGQVGRFNERGFMPYHPEDAPANCGNNTEDFKARSAIAFATRSWSDTTGKSLSNVIYGLTSADVVRVEVRQGGAAPVSARPDALKNDIGPASGAFAVALPAIENSPELKASEGLSGITVTFVRSDGSTSELDF